jgi:4-hydroxybutyrate dehydrogenase/sulfolactaldehyde 3-reductase
MDRIGFIGLGRMGQPMATNLQGKGFGLTVHDVRREPVDALVAHGAVAGNGVAGVSSASDVVVTMLPNSANVEEVVLGPGGVLENLDEGALVMDMSTVDPQATDKLAAAAADAGIGFVDAPVGRLASHADAGESLFMVGAADADYARVKPLLEAMGTTIYHCGPPGAGTRSKLVNNFLAIASCQMNAEALTLAAGFGLDLETTLDVIHGTTATNGQLKLNYATKVLAGDIEPGFTIDLAHKDMSLVMAAANEARVPMPIGAVARESLSLARASGYHAKDFSGLLDHWCERAGVDKQRFKKPQ